MSQTKERKRRSKAVPVLGAAAGLSFSLASSAPAAIGGVNPDPANSSLVSQRMMLCEEQIADVSLATFHVFDKEPADIQQPHARLAMGPADVPVAAAAAVPVGSACTTTIHRRCLAGRSIRHRLVLCGQRTNTNAEYRLIVFSTRAWLTR